MIDICKIGMALCAALLPVSWTATEDPAVQPASIGESASSDETILDVYGMYLNASEEEQKTMDQIMAPSVKQKTVDWIDTQNAAGMSSEQAQKVEALREQDSSLPAPVSAETSSETSDTTQTPAEDQATAEEQKKEKDASGTETDAASDTEKTDPAQTETTDPASSDSADPSKTDSEKDPADSETDPDKSGTDETGKTDGEKNDPAADDSTDNADKEDTDKKDDESETGKSDDEKPADEAEDPSKTDGEGGPEDDTADAQNPSTTETTDSGKTVQDLPESIDAPAEYESVVAETLQPASDSESAPVSLSTPAIIRKATKSRQIRVRDLGWYESEPDYLNQDAWKQSRSSYNTPGLWGQCTWFAWGRFYEMYGFDPGFSGNGNVCAGQLVSAHPDQFELSHTPKAGAVFSSDMSHNHVGIILDVNPETGELLVQEGNLDGVSNTDWSVATADYRTIEISLDGLRSLYGDVVFANPIKGKVEATHQDSRPSYLPTGMPDSKEEQQEKTAKLYGELYD